ncbi:PHD finger protein 21B isoform X2 [Protopterus annectens]|uniref:PHD finger protein 21B isoform X2 n=1 Tax=Protopterus annectens TaxID=7888 RepID=UPI001CF94EB7|nr:PHD finger protein 21B isoform X2 [Protopterus annectens]
MSLIPSRSKNLLCRLSSCCFNCYCRLFFISFWANFAAILLKVQEKCFTTPTMEIQSLQEALKVEIQCHQKLVAQMKQDPQNGELKKQIHERQSRITALSEKQKVAVRSCPIGGTLPIPLIKSPSQSIAISVLPAKNPVTMVTAHINGQKTASTDPPQTVPINLQTTNKLVGSAFSSVGRRVLDASNAQVPRQALGTITAVPIKVPQVSSLQRLAGQVSTVLPQVRPKTLIPDSLPVSPCREQTSKQPQAFHKATVVSIKNPSPALPIANNTASHVQKTSSPLQSVLDSPSGSSSPLSSAGVAYAIISTSPSAATSVNTSTVSVVNDSIKVQPLLISTDSKVIIIHPQVQTLPENKEEIKKSSEEPTQGLFVTKKKKEENAEKVAFMVALGLVTTEHLEEIQSKRQERKRRSTANPAYSGLFEPEKKRLPSNYLNNPLFLTARANEDPSWKGELLHDTHCSGCKHAGGRLQPCGTCSRAYHHECLEPPMKIAQKGVWVCPKCHHKVLKKEENMQWPGTVDASHTYIAHKTVKEEEKRKLLTRGSELKHDHSQLKEKDRFLSSAIVKCLEQKNNLLVQQKGIQSSLERLKHLIRLIQSEQMIQVTMTTTTTSSLLSIPWIKPSATSATVQKALQQSHGNK